MTIALNARIKKILKEQGKTQTWLAEAAGVEAGYLSELLNMKQEKRWNIDLIWSVCSALGVEPWHLLADPAEVYSRHDKAVVSAYLSLSDEDKKIVDRFMFPDQYQFSPSDTPLTDVPKASPAKGQTKEKR